MAGTAGLAGYVNDTGPAARFRFTTPSAAVVDSSGNVFVADSINHTIRKITSAGVVTTFAGSTLGLPGSADGFGTTASFNSPQGLAIDSLNNLYVADTGNHAIRMISAGGSVSTLAGTAGGVSVTSGYTNGVGTAALFRFPSAIAADRAGAGGGAASVYVADTQNNAIRRVVVATRNVTTHAGSLAGIPGNADGIDTGVDNVSRFNAPAGIASDASGFAIYVADTGNHIIRRITFDGTNATVSRLAGSAIPTYVDGTGTTASFNGPTALALDAIGNVVVADTMNQVIRTVNFGGTTTLFAGSPTIAGSSDGLATSGALFNRPTGIAVDVFSNVYVVDTLNSTVRRIANAAAPIITLQPVTQNSALGGTAVFTAAATGTPTPTLQWQRFRVGDSSFTFLPEGGGYTGTTTGTLTISPVTVSMSGDLYQLVASNGAASVTTVAAQLVVALGPIYTTWVGLPLTPGAVDGIGSGARFRAPTNVAVDTAGNVYVADSGNHVIRKVTASGVVTTHAGALALSGAIDGFLTTARFNSPSGVAVDSSNNVYVADTGNHVIRMISSSGNVTTFAGTLGALGSTDGSGATARFSFPSAIAVDAAGSLYVADTLNHTIRKITSGVVSTLAGTAGLQGSADGVTSTARFSFPSGVAVDTALNVYVADTVNHLIRKITSTGSVSTMAGLAGSAGSVDGNGNIARFNQPKGVAVEGTTVYVADSGNHIIRTVSATNDVVTVAGSAGLSGSVDGPLNLARFNSPTGIAVAATVVYVADTQNHTIRRTGSGVPPEITVAPQNQNVAAGGTVSFTVSAAGAPTPSLQWQRRAADSSTFVNLANDGTFSGVTTSTLMIFGVTSALSGSEFRVVATNLVGSPAVSAGATLTIVTVPVFTSATSTTFRVGQNNTFTFTATASPAASFTASGLPSWATLDSTSGVLSGNPPNTSGSPFNLVVTANNGTGSSTAVTQNFRLTVEAAEAPPTIASQPSGTTVNRGENATFSVSAGGSSPLSYQWRRDGAAISGATSSTFVLPNAQASSAGTYSVTVSNAFGSVTSNGATLAVNSAPNIVSQPRSLTVQAGGSATFVADVTGGSGLSYQWRRNGVALANANSATLTLSNVSAADAGNYDVIITNSLGTTSSSVAQLNVVTGPTAPVFTLQPASRTTTLSGNVTLTAAATGVPAPTYQWRHNGAAIGGATNPSFTITNAQAGNAGNYDVVAASSAGTITSGVAGVRVIARSYAGVYFGSFSGSFGPFAMYVRDDNTGVFLGYLLGSSAPVMNLALLVNDAGQFSFSQGAIATAAAVSSDEPARAAALAPVTINGTLGADGSVNGSISGGVSTSFAGSRVADAGPTQGVAGYYQAGATNSGGVAYVITSSNSQAFVVTQVGTVTDGGVGTVSAGGQVSISTARGSVAGSIVPSNGTLSLISSGAVTGSFNGASESVLAVQRLANISSRARVGTGEAVAIAGFVISGEQSKPVLIRAVGPTLGQAPFNVPGVLTTPRLELFRGSASIATNAGIGTNRAAIDAAGVQAGAFALGSAGTDAAIFTTLAPGNYTAIVSSSGTASGVVLVEVYDLSAAVAGQKLLNISTRATAGSAENTLIAGVVVTGSAPKRVLIRAVGPGLTPFGVTGVLAQPTLTLYSGSTAVGANTGWSTSVDAAAITAASAQVGGFGMAAADSAMIVTLAPGNYTAQVTGPGAATGVALIELYELP